MLVTFLIPKAIDIQSKELSGKGKSSASATRLLTFKRPESKTRSRPISNIFSLMSVRKTSPWSPTISENKIAKSPVPPATSNTEPFALRLLI